MLQEQLLTVVKEVNFMNNKLFKPTKRLQLSIAGVDLDGIISGCNFMVLLKVLELIFE